MENSHFQVSQSNKIKLFLITKINQKTKFIHFIIFEHLLQKNICKPLAILGNFRDQKVDFHFLKNNYTDYQNLKTIQTTKDVLFYLYNFRMEFQIQIIVIKYPEGYTVN